jgi:hypothetical protein
MPRHRALAAVTLGLLLLTLVACGNEGASADKARPAAFTAERLTWAQGPTIHYGDQALAVDGRVEQLWRTPYAFLAVVRRGKGNDSSLHTLVVDGQGSTQVAGSPDDVHVSPDGRYAGWIDYDGPKQSNGRLAQVVVADLRTGRTVFRNHEQMGGPKDDLGDLYEDADMGFLGFDDDYAYWQTPKGAVRRRRAPIGSWQPQAAEKPSPTGSEADAVPFGLPYDALVGRRTGMRDDGREAHDGDGTGGFVSPDSRWCLTDGLTAHLTVVDCRSGAQATPAYPAKWVFFGGWHGPDDFYALTRRHYDFTVDLSGDDHSTGMLVSCSLATRRCEDQHGVTGADTVILPTGEPLE